MKRSILCLILLLSLSASTVKAQTIAISHSSGEEYQSFEITINGDGINFKSFPVGIVFYLDANDSFYSVPNKIVSQTKLTAYVTIPGFALPGAYDVRIVDTLTDSIFYLASGAFTVNPALPPSISINPDSGAAGTNFDVTINGSNTFFNADSNNSRLDNIEIDLLAFGSVYYSAHPSSISTDSTMKVLFILPDTLSVGYYIARVYTTGIQPSFADSQYFRVKPVPVITLPNTNSGQAGTTVSVDVLVQGSPIPGPNTQVFLAPTGNHANMLPVKSDTITSDSTLTAVFTLPSTLSLGSYDIIILAFNDLALTGKSVFTVLPFSGVDMNIADNNVLEVSPNPAEDHVDFIFSLPNAVHVRLTIFDALGRNITTLCDATMSGQQNIDWNSDNVPNGSYFYELVVGDAVYHGSVVVQR